MESFKKYSEMTKSEKEILLKFMFTHPAYDAVDLVFNTGFELDTINNIREEHGFKPLRIDKMTVDAKINDVVTKYPSVSKDALIELLGIKKRADPRTVDRTIDELIVRYIHDHPEKKGSISVQRILSYAIAHPEKTTVAMASDLGVKPSQVNYVRQKYKIKRTRAPITGKVEAYLRSRPGDSPSEISEKTGVNISTVHSCIRKLGMGKRHIDYGPVEDYITMHPDASIADISKKFGISIQSVHRAMNLILSSRGKKRRRSMKDEELIEYMRVHPRDTVKDIAKWANTSVNAIYRIEKSYPKFRIFRFKALVEMMGNEKHLDENIIKIALDIIDASNDEKMNDLINRYITASSRRNIALGILYLAMRQNPVVACSVLPKKWFESKVSFMRLLREIQDTVGVESTPPDFVCIIPEQWLDNLGMNTTQKIQIRNVAQTIHDVLPKDFTTHVNRTVLRSSILFYVMKYLLEIPVRMNQVSNATGTSDVSIRAKASEIASLLEK